MTPSTSTPVAAGVTHLPPAGREETIERWGLNPSAHWGGVDRRPIGVDDAAEIDATEAYHDEDFDGSIGAQRALEEFGFVQEGGWTPVSIKNNRGFRTGAEAPGKGGLVSHRGVVHPGEYVDPACLRVLIEEELGFTYDDLHAVYSTGGRIPSILLGLRSKIDARLLEIAEADANMDAFGRAVGINARTVDRALARARSTQAVAA